jgi:hypothetical protein
MSLGRQPGIVAVIFTSIGSRAFASKCSLDNARGSPARTESSVSRYGSQSVRDTNIGDCVALKYQPR